VERLSLLLNERLPGDLVARSASPAPPGFHPRFEATARVYAYRIYRDEDVPVDRMRYVAAWPGRWDWPAVREAAASIAGTHAFHAFAEGSLSPFYAKCTLDRLRTTERGPEVALHFRGDRFLRQMVRRLAAALCEVAAGRASPSTFAAAVEGKLRFQFKPAPAHGLVLEQVEYGNEDARDEHNAVLY
jgi:tRNA pseudouridine38-40 synthase